MGCSSSKAGAATSPVPPSAGRPQQPQQEQQQRSVAPAATKATKKGATAVVEAPKVEPHFAEFPGQDAFAGADAEVIDASDVAAAKKVCLQKGYGGFALVDGKAHFRKESAEACLRALKAASNTTSTFFAAPHEGRNFLSVKVVTYNVTSSKQASGLSAAGELVAATKADIVGLQECEDVTELLHAGGAQEAFEYQQGPHGLATCFRAGAWSLVAEGGEQVAVDAEEAFESARSVLWTRLQHKATGKHILFVNHQGALPQNSGGRTGAHKVCCEILQIVKKNKVAGDQVVLAGDFRAIPDSDLSMYLETAYHRAFSGESESSTDHFFSSMQAVKTETVGAAGSDRSALAATFLAH